MITPPSPCAVELDVFDEPFGDQAALPTMLLSKFSRKEVIVALTGEGADDLLSGYANYAKLLELWFAKYAPDFEL